MWACELKSKEVILFFWCVSHAPRERVSWNLSCCKYLSVLSSHAPRERVSWNAYTPPKRMNVCWSRSTWACELKYINFIVTSSATMSRSTWACESIFVSTQDLLILNNTNNRLTKVGRYFYTQILYIFHVFSVKSANSHPEICANKWFII